MAKQVDAREVDERQRERLAGRPPSLMGDFKASRLSVYVAHAPFHIRHTQTYRNTEGLPVALGHGTRPNTLADAE